jgi:hypothetical protein
VPSFFWASSVSRYPELGSSKLILMLLKRFLGWHFSSNPTITTTPVTIAVPIAIALSIG